MKLLRDVRMTRLFRCGDDPIRDPLHRLDLLSIARELDLGSDLRDQTSLFFHGTGSLSDAYLASL